MKSIRQRLDAQKAFRQRMRDKYPQGPPRVRVGMQIETVFGPGIVVDIEEHFKIQYPLVEINDLSAHGTALSRTLRLYPYEHDCEPLEVCDVAS